MSGYRKLGRKTKDRKAMLRNLTTNLLYHEKIVTTETRAKEVRRMAEKLITIAVKEHENYEEVTVMAKVPKKDANGKRIKTEVNGKRVTEYYEMEKTIKKDLPGRLNARRKILSVLYPVVEVPAGEKRKKNNSVEVDMAKVMFEKVAPRYVDRNGGYTRIIKLGARKGDGAEEVILELV